jgi:hypothetical protein
MVKDCRGMVGWSHLTAVAIISITALLVGACASGCRIQNSHGACCCVGDGAEATESDVKKVNQLIRSWCKSRGWREPQRIVVAKKTPDLWIVTAGPEEWEATFEVDPKKMCVLKCHPGY